MSTILLLGIFKDMNQYVVETSVLHYSLQHHYYSQEMEIKLLPNDDYMKQMRHTVQITGMVANTDNASIQKVKAE